MSTERDPQRHEPSPMRITIVVALIGAAGLVLAAGVTGAFGVLSSSRDVGFSPPDQTASPTGVTSRMPNVPTASFTRTVPPARIIEPAKEQLIPLCPVIRGTAPPETGNQAYWLVGHGTHGYFLAAALDVDENGNWTSPIIQVGKPEYGGDYSLLLVRTDDDQTKEFRQRNYEGNGGLGLTVPMGVQTEDTVIVKRTPMDPIDPQSGCPAP